jgi:serine/threonine-protein kinase HipA
MAYGPNDERDARIVPLVEASAVYHLDKADARDLVNEQVEVIRGAWDEVCDDAHLTAQQRATFLGRQFLNPSVFERGDVP